jgi:iron complex transport system ATP-binding protein
MGRHAYGGALEPTDPDDIAAVARALDAVKMEAFRPRRLSQLSGGERRRAWLASALAQEPELLLLDEPTQALDVHHAAAVMEVLARKATEGLRVVVVLHDLNLAALYCDRLILLQDGQVTVDGPPADILSEDRLVAAYGRHVEVIVHPETKKPVILAKK